MRLRGSPFETPRQLRPKFVGYRARHSDLRGQSVLRQIDIVPGDAVVAITGPSLGNGYKNRHDGAGIGVKAHGLRGNAIRVDGQVNNRTRDYGGEDLKVGRRRTRKIKAVSGDVLNHQALARWQPAHQQVCRSTGLEGVTDPVVSGKLLPFPHECGQTEFRHRLNRRNKF